MSRIESSGYPCPHIDRQGVRCELPTQVFKSEQRPAGRYRRRSCAEGHRCTTVEVTAAGAADASNVGPVLEQAAYAVDTLRDIVGTARRLLRTSAPSVKHPQRRKVQDAAQGDVQSDGGAKA